MRSNCEATDASQLVGTQLLWNEGAG